MSAVIAGHLLISSVHALQKFYRILRPYRIGIYGPSMTGKTTLDQYLTVPGDIDPIPIEMRTSHPMVNGHAKAPKPHRKLIKYKKDRIPISNSDIAGQAQFRNLWIEDMFGRKCEIVIFMVDHRVLTSPSFAKDSLASFRYLIDNITRKDVSTAISRKAKKTSRSNYMPKVVVFLVNKMDLWWSPQAQYLWDNNLQREHPIVAPFRNELRRLRKAGVRADIDAISAQHGVNVEKVLISIVELL
jgi:GTPase SAR1 family protein